MKRTKSCIVLSALDTRRCNSFCSAALLRRNVNVRRSVKGMFILRVCVYVSFCLWGVIPCDYYIQVVRILLECFLVTKERPEKQKQSRCPMWTNSLKRALTTPWTFLFRSINWYSDAHFVLISNFLLSSSCPSDLIRTNWNISTWSTYTYRKLILAIVN